MGRLLFVLAIGVLVAPLSSEACEGSKSKMELQVRQVGPPIKIREKQRGREFIVFRGDMRMQEEEIRMEQIEQEKHRVPASVVIAAQAAPAPVKKVVPVKAKKVALAAPAKRVAAKTAKKAAKKTALKAVPAIGTKGIQLVSQ